jgi:hypothetical protein
VVGAAVERADGDDVTTRALGDGADRDLRVVPGA